jgi:hypothetical protein
MAFYVGSDKVIDSNGRFGAGQSYNETGFGGMIRFDSDGSLSLPLSTEASLARGESFVEPVGHGYDQLATGSLTGNAAAVEYIFAGSSGSLMNTSSAGYQRNPYDTYCFKYQGAYHVSSPSTNLVPLIYLRNSSNTIRSGSSDYFYTWYQYSRTSSAEAVSATGSSIPLTLSHNATQSGSSVSFTVYVNRPHDSSRLTSFQWTGISSRLSSSGGMVHGYGVCVHQEEHKSVFIDVLGNGGSYATTRNISATKRGW